MGTQNLNNYYFNKLDAKIDYSSYYDLFLLADEREYNSEVIWSNQIIGANDTSILPVIIDLNNPQSSSQPVTTAANQYPIFTGTPQSSEPFTIQSSVQWSSAQTICDCDNTFMYQICSVYVGEEARSNGLYHDKNIDNLKLAPPQDCVRIFKNIPTVSNFNKLHFGKKFKMSQVKAYGMPQPPGSTTTYYTDTSIRNASDASGYYQELRGGFYQGFYKIQDVDYQVLPTRPNKGWTFSTYLKLNTIGDTLLNYGESTGDGTYGVYGNCYNASGFNSFVNSNSGVTTYTFSAASAPPITSPWLNSNPPTFNQGGLNHLLNYSQIVGLTTNATGDTIPVIHSGVTDNTGFFFFKGTREGRNYEAYDNAFGVRLRDDMSIGYRVLRWSGYCDCGPSYENSYNYEPCGDNCNFKCQYVVEESYSEPICPFITKSGNCENVWVQVDVVFERNYYLEDCDLLNIGGINDLIMTDTTYPNNLPYAYSGDNPCDTFNPGPLNYECTGTSVQNWFNEKKYRLGTLKFYVNGRVVHTVKDYEEIIPRHNNINKSLGIPYNMSWGGGAFGFREERYPTPNYMDPIGRYFGGSFVGGISQMMYYIKPLTADEIYHNFLINRDRYSLIDCEECKNCNSGCIDCDPDPYSGLQGPNEPTIVMPGTGVGLGNDLPCTEDYYVNNNYAGAFTNTTYVPGQTYSYPYSVGDIVMFMLPMIDGSSQLSFFELLNVPMGGWNTNPSNEVDFLEQSPVYDSGIYWNNLCNGEYGNLVIFGCIDPNDPSYDPAANVDNSITMGGITYYPLC
jgi:hypothetical protein